MDETHHNGEEAVFVDDKSSSYSSGSSIAHENCLCMFLMSIIEWCKWYGPYVMCYGTCVLGLIDSILSPLKNTYQGGNKFPYLSEIIRSGFEKFLFTLGCSLGSIPTLLFAWNYFKITIQYSRYIPSKFSRWSLRFWEFIEFILSCWCGIGVLGVCFNDMDHHGDMHSTFSTSWILSIMILEIINWVSLRKVFFKGNHARDDFMRFKAWMYFLQIAGVGMFVVLGTYRPCHSHNMPIAECLRTFKEEYCFSILDNRFKDCTFLRQYGHCPILHYIRGIGEMIGIFCGMIYFVAMIYDLKDIKLKLDGLKLGDSTL